MPENSEHISYSAADIEKYFRKEMPAAEMHALEKAALEDPFLADAMEGYEAKASGQEILPDLADLKARLAERVHRDKKARIVGFSWWKAAAVVFVLMGGSWLYISINSHSIKQTIAKNTAASKVAPLPVTGDSSMNASPSADTASLAYNFSNTRKKQKPVTANTGYKKKWVAADSAVAVVTNQLPVAANTEEDNTPGKAAEPKNKVASSASSAPSNNILPGRAAAEKNFVTKDARKKDATTDGLTRAPAGMVAKADTLERRTVNLSNTFNGVVLDQRDKPLSNAVVQIPNLNISTSTDNNGYFSFKARDTALKVSIASVGFETQYLDLTTNSIEDVNNVIRLKPSLLRLNEVVVTGYGTKKRKSPIGKSTEITIQVPDAEPSVDMNTYNAYLEKNKNLPEEIKNVHGEVVVAFTVGKRNTLTNFHLEKSLNDQADAEAIRLVREGPSWKLLKGKKASARVTVKF